MRIAILSDIHDNLWNLAAALESIRARDCEALICCGDLCSPFVVDRLRTFPGPVHIVFGNNDADLYRITRKCDSRVQAHGEIAELELGGRKIGVNHFDGIARSMAHSGLYDVVCYGHNHRFAVSQINGTLAINPGPIMGAAGFSADGWEDVPGTFVVYDTAASGRDAVAAYRVMSEGASVERVVSYVFEITESWPI